MKKIIVTAFVAILGASQIQAQDMETDTTSQASPNFAKLDVSPMDLVLYRDANDVPVARVIYSRPQKREREIFGKLVPYGKIWRTGANEATELTLYKDMMVANTKIEAGTYTLYTIPKEKEWTVILNKKVHTWGAYEYSEQEDKVRINVPARETNNTIEALSMAFERAPDGANLLIGWDDRYVKVPFKEIK